MHHARGRRHSFSSLLLLLLLLLALAADVASATGDVSQAERQLVEDMEADRAAFQVFASEIGLGAKPFISTFTTGTLVSAGKVCDRPPHSWPLLPSLPIDAEALVVTLLQTTKVGGSSF